VAIVLLVVMLLLTVADVGLRYLFGHPLRGTTELTEYLMVCVGTLPLAWCALRRGHIKVELIAGRLPQTTQKVLDIFNYSLAIIMSAVIASQTFLKSVFEGQLGVTSVMLDIPKYPFVLVVTFSYALLFFASIILLAQSISSLVSERGGGR